MKTFGLWLKMAGLCLMFALAFPACSDDDEEKEEPGGVENVKTGWSEDGNTATFKYSYTVPGTKYTVAYVYTFKFNGNSCTGASCSVTCPTEQIAQMVYENLDAEDKVLFKLSGKTADLQQTGLLYRSEQRRHQKGDAGHGRYGLMERETLHIDL